ncbi:hypothetical protein Bbelb_252830 [Branchiostoma belcheri]|nr:hypothetical protein Bbelb_252830 [Branchiostoma belcheri]
MDGSANCEVTVGSGVDDVRSMTWFDPWDRKGTVTGPAEQQAAEDVPVLQLTNFAVTPRIGFGLVRVCETQTRKLLLHNPEQFPVTVAVEKVPRAKGFSVDFGEVEVQAGEDTVVSVQWTPGEACNSRALLVLKLDDAYRLHVILYGRAVVPVAGKQKRAKKRTRPREAVKQGSAPVSGSDRKSRAVSDTDAENTPPVSSHQPSICDSPQIKLGSSEKLKLAKNIVNRSGKQHQDVPVVNNCSTDATVPPGTTATVPGTTATVPGTTATVPDPANSSSVQKTKRILQPSTVTKRKQNFGKSSDGVRIKAAKKELFGTSTSLSAQLQHQAVPQQPTNVHAAPPACNLVKSDKNSHSQDMPMGPAGSGKPFVFRSAVSKNKGTPANSVPQKVLMKKGVAQTKKSQPVKARSTQGETSGGTARCQPKVAKSKLCLVKTSNKQQSVQALHYMPYVSKNMYYDERWMQKQERAFIQWLNFILIPNTMEPQLCQTVTVPGRMPAVSVDQQLRMREYAVLCNLNSVRRAACLLFQSEPVARVLQRVEEEVETGRLRVRDDRHLHADQGIRQQILDMLLSYSPLWLRVGLETIFGEVLPLQHNGDVAGLSRFVLNRVLGNPDIAQQFSHPTVPHMYKPGYAAALAKFTLKKFLTLVFFMDTAKLTRLIDHDPCLFCINANIKSNKELLLSFSREYLSGEGDVTRHLSFLGLTVTHQQTALMEMDYTVHNLATDLRDGLRLIRAVELLTRNWTLSSKLRAPAVSRLQKIHNTKLALDALQQAGVALDAGLQGKKIEARDIVDGRQEKTLALLWKLIFHFQVCMEVEHLQLQKEVTLLRRELQLRRGTDVWLEMYGPTPGSAGTTDHTGLLLQLCQAVCAFYNIRVDNFSVSFSDGRVLCLLVHHYLPELLPLEEIYMDTTQSYITNHRQAGTGTGEGPETDKDRFKELLAHEKNNFRLVNQKQLGKSGVAAVTSLPQIIGGALRHLSLGISGAKQNQVLELGTIPPLLCVADMSNTIPDEKVVMTAVSYLCARIINLSQKVRAVRTIQAAWRKYHPKPAVREWTESVQRATIRLQAAVRGTLVRRSLQRQHKSATTIQTAVRGWTARQHYLKQRKGAIILQQHVSAHLARKHAQARYQHVRRATIRLQAAVRGMHVRRRQKQMQMAATRIQACWRGHQQSVKYKAIKLAATIIQQHFKSFKVMQEKQHKYRSLRSATIQLQAAVRGMLVRKLLQRQHKSATTIQTAVRRWTARQQYLKQRQAAIILQDHVRAHLARKQAHSRYQHVRRATIRLQAAVRGMHVRRRQKQMQMAATRIQACWRGHQQSVKYKAIKLAATIIQQHFKSFKVMQEKQHKYRSLRSATICLQAAVRGMLVHRSLQRQHKSATTIQTAVRGWTARQQYLKQRQAAIMLQQHVRAHFARKQAQMKYQLVRRATIRLQAAVRGTLVRRSLQRQHKSATTIQTAVRGWTARQQFLKQRKGAIILQQHVRAHLARKHAQARYQHVRRATIRLQAAVRGMHVRRRQKQMQMAATRIQACWRGHQQSVKYKAIKLAATIIQQHFKSFKVMQEKQHKYRSLRSATIQLQAAVRGMLVRKMLQRQHKSATTIQTAVRGWTARQQYLKERQAAIMLQQHVRAHLARKHVQARYQSVRRATIRLQAAVRGTLVRRSLQRQHKSATTIQTAVRGWTARQHYLKQRKGAIILQQHVRAHLARKHAQARYQHVRRATIRLQAAVRGMHVRRRQKQMQMAATRIQACWRGHQQSVKYKAIKLAATIIQQHFKSFKVMQEKQHKYRSLRSATIQLQAAVRGMLLRKMLQRQHKSATIIQTAVRGRTARQQFLKQRQAAIILQQHVRAHLARKHVQARYQHVRRATIRLQAAVRGMHVRRRQKQMQMAATRIQACWRGHQQSVKYKAIKLAATIIQQYFKSFKVMQEKQHKYRSLRSATICLQAAVRGMLVRRSLQRQHKSATTIQTAVRGWTARQQFLKQRQATIILQQRVRAHFARKQAQMKYQLVRRATIRLQAAVHGTLVRRSLQRQHKSATTIQTAVRGWTARQQYLKQRQATIILQQCVRAHLARKQAQARYQHVRRATIRLQAAVRGMHVRRRQKQMQMAATRIQACWRGHQQSVKYKAIKLAATVIQQHFKSFKVMQEKQHKYRSLRSATICLQAAVRGMLLRKLLQRQHKSATTIQTAVRGWTARQQYLKERQAAIMLQQHVRAHLARKHAQARYQIVRWATIRLQAAVRGMLVRRSLQRQHKSATTIQTAVRGWTARQHYLKHRQASIILQQHVRAHLARKHAQARYQHVRRATIRLQAAVRGMHVRRRQKQMQMAATRIQACWRGHQQSVKYKAIKLAATIIQQHFKSFKVMQEKQHKYRSLRSATIQLQAAVRGMLVRKMLQRQHKSATIIQTAVRGWTARQHYLKQRQAAIILQQHVRAHLARKHAQARYQHVRRATIQLQAGIRGFLARQQLIKWTHASTVIQASFRCFLQRRRYLSTRAAVCRLQAGFRGWTARRTFQQVKLQHRAAVVIQSTYRGFAARRCLQQWRAEQQRRLLHFSTAAYYHLAAMRLQRAYRRYLVWQKAKQQLKALIIIQASIRAWLQRKHFLQLRRVVCKLQAAVRCHQKQRLTAAVVLQSYVRMYLAKKLAIRRRKAVIALQATWRGYHTRKNIKNKRIRIAHQKIMAAKRAATEDKKLCNMTATALNLLLKYKHLSTILDALRSLEVVTRLSSVCCDRLVQGGAVQVIYTLIQSCNRSLPCQEIIKYSISILLNLAKNPDTVAAAVVQEGGVETLVSLMAIYREKDDVIFGQTLEQKDPYALEDGGNAAVIHNDTGSFEHAISDSEAAEFVPPGKEEDFHEQKQTENRKSGGQKKESYSPGPDGSSDQASLDPRERQHA